MYLKLTGFINCIQKLYTEEYLSHFMFANFTHVVSGRIQDGVILFAIVEWGNYTGRK